MMLKKIDVLSPYALAAMVTLVALLMSGCDRRDEVYPVEGNAYLKDPAFTAKLDLQVERRKALRKERILLDRKLNELVAGRFGGDRVAATNSVEGAALVAAILASENAYVSNHLESAAIIRERRAQAIADSERIKRGEAKPIDLSKREEK